MRIFQLLPCIIVGDAISNDTIMLDNALKEFGYNASIYAELIDHRLPADLVNSYDDFPEINDDDLIIYHKSTGTKLSFNLNKYKCKKIMIYHNITPSSFFEEYNPNISTSIAWGYKGLSALKDVVDYCLADSNYNKNELLKEGYTCPIDVRPILIDFDDYKKTPDQTIIDKYSDDGYVNLLFVGRVVPNKKQENLIRAFYEYHKINPKSRLFLVGNNALLTNYYQRLKDYVFLLGLDDSVIFTGNIKFNSILAYYKIADVFLCMSEHEGFCVPLVESMFFNVPIIAYDTSAISDTLGDSGILLDSNEPLIVARTIDKLVTDKELIEFTIKKQQKRLENFSYDNVSKIFTKQLTTFIENNMDSH